MPRVGFEPTTPVFERAKTVHVLDLAVTVIGFLISYLFKIYFIIILYLRLDLPSDLLALYSPTKILYLFLIFTTCVKYQDHLPNNTW
jgi:hypothetical protein